MVDGLSLCSCLCVTCLWCSLLALCFPKLFKNLQESDSSVCCTTGVNLNTKKNISRVIKEYKSSLENNDAKITSRVPKCTIRIIRKNRIKSPREKSDEKLETSLAVPDKRETSCYCAVAYTEMIDSGVQTEFYKRQRSPRMQAEPEGNRRRMDRRESCSDKSLIYEFERGKRYGQEKSEDGIKNSKLSARCRDPIFYDCDHDDRCCE